MPPKVGAAKARAKAKADATLRAALDAGGALTYARGSQVGRLGGLRLTNARGEETAPGALHRAIARERGLSESLDP